jgi:hypothetical protein
MTDTYKPRAGSAADKIMRFLRSQPRGTEFSTPELIERTGISTRDIFSVMATPKRLGIINSRIDASGAFGKVAYWSMPRPENDHVDMREYPSWMICSPVRLPMRADARWLA